MTREPVMNAARACADVDLGALERNYLALRKRLSGGVAMLCVIKADAYGHGAVPVARVYERLGAEYFGVATMDEGLELREAGLATPLLVLSGILPWDDAASFVDHGLVPALSDIEMLERAGRLSANRRVSAHLKIDTGMGRLGFAPDQVPELIERLKGFPGLEVEGIMTHFPSSDRRDAHGLQQVARFKELIQRFAVGGIRPRLVHMANSGGLVNYPEAHFSMVRPGIMLYGSYPDEGLRDVLPLEPVMTLRSHVALVRHFPAGTPLSYGGTFVTDRPTTVAYVPVGYADGYPRALSNKGAVLVRGTRCPVLGRVCMDWTLADVTDVPGACRGDEVVLLGGRNEDAITADEVAAKVGTIPYEILCGISGRIPRVYV